MKTQFLNYKPNNKLTKVLYKISLNLTIRLSNKLMRVSTKIIILTNLEWMIILKFIEQQMKTDLEVTIQDYKKIQQEET